MATSIIKNLIQFTPLSASEYGCVKIPIAKLCIVWGAKRMGDMSYDSASGGYAHTIDLSGYGFTGVLQAFVSSRYGGGFPRVGIATVSASSIKILSDVNVGSGYVHWIVIGQYN